MTVDEIITKFELQVDDASELSSDEALELANDVYQEVQDDRPWEWLRTTATGTTSTTVPYIALPSDFKMMMPNAYNEAVIYVGTDYSPYKVIGYDQRRDYRDQDGFCYIDVPNSRLVFTLQPTSTKTIEYDYVKVATALVLGASPIFRSGFHKVIMWGMAARFPSIEQADKTTSYAGDNRATYRSILSDMAIEDANLKLAHA